MLKYVSLIIAIIILIINLWRNSFFHFDTHLINWFDELFEIWIFQTNIQHFSTLNFKDLYETNALYSFKYTLSFAEQMFFPSFIAFLVSIFNKNPIFQFNFIIISNQILIFLSSLLFFNKLFKNKVPALLSAFYVTFSPYFFSEIGHLQMVFYWPLFISLYFLVNFKETQKKTSIVLAAIFLGFQFLSSIYLGIMSLFITSAYLFLQWLELNNKRIFILKKYLIFLLIFSIISSVSIYGYYLVRIEYGAKRDYGEFITYSAHITDYLFPSINQKSFLYTTPIILKLKSFNHHLGGAPFIGFIPLLMLVYLLFPKLGKIKQNFNISWTFTPLILLSIFLIFVGFLFSLGPRLSANGVYLHIPLPYDLLLRIFKPLEIMRCVIRWQFLIMIGVSILIGLSYTKLDKYLKNRNILISSILLPALLILFAIEFYPINPFSASAKTWPIPIYQMLNSGICKTQGKIILEYPFNYRNLDGNLAKGVNYMATILLNSSQHKCRTLSGYYGFEPPKYVELKTEFENGFDEKDYQLIKKLKIDYVKLNKYALSDKEVIQIKSSKNFSNFNILYEDADYIILSVK